MHEKDLLGCLLNSKDENGEVLSDDKIADNIIGVLFAAQDTTASIMTWIVKYLHDNPKLLEGVKVLSCLSIYKKPNHTRGLSRTRTSLTHLLFLSRL